MTRDWTAADYARDASDQTEDANQAWRAEYATEDTFDDNQPSRNEADADAALDAADDARMRPDPWLHSPTREESGRQIRATCTCDQYQGPWRDGTGFLLGKQLRSDDGDHIYQVRRQGQ